MLLFCKRYEIQRLPVTAEENLTPAAPAAVPNPTAGMTTKVVRGNLITTPFVIRMLVYAFVTWRAVLEKEEISGMISRFSRLYING